MVSPIGSGIIQANLHSTCQAIFQGSSRPVYGSLYISKSSAHHRNLESLQISVRLGCDLCVEVFDTLGSDALNRDYLSVDYSIEARRFSQGFSNLDQEPYLQHS